MLLQRFEDPGLSQYSYAVACPASGEVAVVDPRRDVDVYRDFAQERGLKILHVFETHIHADFASGARDLARLAGASLHLSRYDEGETYDVSFPHEPMADGDSIEIGSVRIQALHTPGHTPEHLGFLIFDTKRSASVPVALLSGDFLFVGSLGRPDLLGEEAKRGLAGRLFESVRERLAPLPDGLEIHPAHGAGSMCGSGMGGRPSSTLGYERVANPYLDPSLDREAFVEKILSTVPPFPPYYRRMKRINSDGPASLVGGLPLGEAIEPADFQQRIGKGRVVVDVRDPFSFGGGHVPGAYGIGAGSNLSKWAAWVVPYDRPILLVVPDPETVEGAVRSLVRVGLDGVEGYLRGGMSAWLEGGHPVRILSQVPPRELAVRLREDANLRVLDVRSDEEWREGHIEGAIHVTAGFLQDRLEEVPRGGGTIAVICGSGYRSTVASSLLQRAGFEDVVNVTGGMRAWRMADLPVVPA